MKKFDTTDKIIIGALSLFGIVAIDNAITNICKYKTYKCYTETVNTIYMSDNTDDEIEESNE